MDHSRTTVDETMKYLILGGTSLFSAFQSCCVGCRIAFPVLSHRQLLALPSNRIYLLIVLDTVLIRCMFTLSRDEEEKERNKERKSKFPVLKPAILSRDSGALLRPSIQGLLQYLFYLFISFTQ